MAIPTMNPNAKELALAILTRLREKEAGAGKTKVLKLLYLADIEHVRTAGKTLTGFNWSFYFYGPWTKDYDVLIEQLEAEGVITKRKWAKTAVEGENLIANEPRDLGKILTNTTEYFRTRRLIDHFAEQSTSDLLDYVYFETEPMENASQGDPLDFSSVSHEAPQFYRRIKSGASLQRLRELRTRFESIRDRLAKEAEANLRRTHPPTYDDKYLSALEALNQPGEE